MGVGRDYNEDLLEAMAKSGDGNYYYIESPVQLADFFAMELRGLMATVGQRVVLGIEPRPGVAIVDVLNDLERDPQGRLMLPNLVAGLPVEIVLRLEVGPQAASDVAQLCSFRLEWQDPRQGGQSNSADLTLPGVSESNWNSLPTDSRVREQAALQLAGRHKREATRHLDHGDTDQALAWLQRSEEVLADLEASDEVQQEKQDIQQVRERAEEGDQVAAAKLGKYQHWRRSRSKPRQ
jgi:Ca-activated chloride channel family protein